MSPPPTKSVLLVDNDFGFLILAMDAIRATTSVAIAFQIALDGAEAINYLRGEVEYTDRARYPLPDLVLSQMNLAGMSGLDLLAWIKRQPQFQDLPVILMYSEQDAVSADEAQQLGANLILSKPVSPQSSYDFSKQVLDLLFST
jgi:CheY-like chemotaxis protein